MNRTTRRPTQRSRKTNPAKASSTNAAMASKQTSSHIMARTMSTTSTTHRSAITSAPTLVSTRRVSTTNGVSRGASGIASRRAITHLSSTTSPFSSPQRSITKVPMFINGEFVDSKTDTWIDVICPKSGKVIAKVPQSTPEELNAATTAAQDAFKNWRDTPIAVRQRQVGKLKDLMQQHEDEIAESIVKETGKTFADAKGDVFRGIEVFEYATGVAQHMKGETLEQLSRDIDTYTYRQPLGVFASIMPFNFPSMLPSWTTSIALATGNTMVLKPSEKTPTAALIMARLSKQAGLPDGVLNVIHGAHDTVNYICDEPRIKGISFVGSNTAGEYIHNRGSANGKRVQANMAAKNHGIVMPDTDKEATLNKIVGAFASASGQRCMALTAAVFVGETKSWINDLADKARGLRCGPNPDSDAGPIISRQNLERIHDIIAEAERDGATIVLDGRNPNYIDEAYKDGNWIGPTIISGVKPHMRAYREEIFGPVIVCLEANDLDEAISICNKNQWGNGAAIFTESGAAARKFQYEIDSGQVGINIPIPIAPAFFSFSSSKASFRGTSHFYGREAVSFFTQLKTITSAWKYTPETTKIETAFPQMGDVNMNKQGPGCGKM